MAFGLDAYWVAFQRLTSERQLGFGAPGRIPWSKIDAYARAMGFMPQYVTFLEIIEELDRAYLDWVTEELKRKQEKPGG